MKEEAHAARTAWRRAANSAIGHDLKVPLAPVPLTRASVAFASKACAPLFDWCVTTVKEAIALQEEEAKKLEQEEEEEQEVEDVVEIPPTPPQQPRPRPPPLGRPRPRDDGHVRQAVVERRRVEALRGGGAGPRRPRRRPRPLPLGLPRRSARSPEHKSKTRRCGSRGGVFCYVLSREIASGSKTLARKQLKA